MTRVFDTDGRSFAVTRVKTLPCKISQIKTKDKDGYEAVQVSAQNREKKGRSAKIYSKIAEFKVESTKKYKVNDEIKTDQFKKNEVVTVEGRGKGKGFAGTIKRHGFAQGPVTHGSHNIRQPGSIGGGYPERVVKGRKMPGRLGGKNVTINNLRIIDLDKDEILVSGAVPGAYKSIVKIYGKGEKAEEVVDHAAEEERLAKEKMLEADAEEKAEKAEGSTENETTESQAEVKVEKDQTDNESVQ